MATSREHLGENARREVGKSLIDLEHSAILELYEFYYDINEQPFRFHAGTNSIVKDIVWHGNKYYPVAVEVEGFEANMLGRLPRPKITIANSDTIISSIMKDYADFRNSKFVRIKVFLKHLDNENFDGGINPFGTADPLAYISKEKYLFSQKLVENKQLLQFELITPFDIQSLQTPARSIYARYCYWQYRGSGCGYCGDLISKENDQDLDAAPNQTLKNPQFKSYSDAASKLKWITDKLYYKGDIVSIANIDFNGLKDPPYTWYICLESHTSSNFINPAKSPKIWQKEGCAKTLEACKKRFKNGSYSSINGLYVSINDTDIMNGMLPFGGFVGTDKFKNE